MKKAFVYLILILQAVFACSSGHASPNVETWDSDTAGWLIKDYSGGAAYGSLSWAATLPLNEQPGVLQVTGGAPADPTPRDIIYTTGGGLAGNINYATSLFTIMFDFYAAAVPVKLDAYLLGSGYKWFFDLTPSLSAGWNSLSAPIGGTWYNIDDGRSGADFVADIADVDEIGIMITYNLNQGGQVYGLDNFDVIPEPETWAFLGIAFLSIGYSFRDRLEKALAVIKARIRG